MSSTTSVDKNGDPQPLPSLPGSPTMSEDLSRAPAWVEDAEQDEQETTPRKSKDKGKGRVVDADVEETGEEVSEEEIPRTYPPTNEDAAETRKIEENLRRWEQNERQRRKAARESIQQQNRSLVADVTRRASLLWPRKANPSHPSRVGRSEDLGTHAVLKSSDEVDFVPMEDIADSPNHIAQPSPYTSPRVDGVGENPFDHPADPISPFDDTHAQASHAVMDESAPPPSASASDPLVKSASKAEAQNGRPTLLASSSSFRNPPKAQPLGLPPPLTPPPPSMTHPPGATDPPSVGPHAATSPELEPEPTRWWTDWLCGCSEGPDRGGDHQAGRTNPCE